MGLYTSYINKNQDYVFLTSFSVDSPDSKLIKSVSTITQMMEAVCMSETSVCFNKIIWHYIKEDCVIFMLIAVKKLQLHKGQEFDHFVQTTL
jgi:hypothetical protein